VAFVSKLFRHFREGGGRWVFLGVALGLAMVLVGLPSAGTSEERVEAQGFTRPQKLSLEQTTLQPTTTTTQAPAPTTTAPIPPPSTTTTVTAPPSPPQTVAPTPPPSPVTAGSRDWDAVAQCESGGNWSINTGNGYYGGLQFSLSTWRGVGGPGYPHEHSRETQIHYAEILYSQRGASPWPVCGRYL
jgi:hypothetical protein